MTEAEKSYLQAVLSLLNDSKNLYDYGDFKAHEVADQARQMLASFIENGGCADGGKTT